jgi:hypothetical protein
MDWEWVGMAQTGTQPEMGGGGSPYKKDTFWLATSNRPVLPSRYLKLPGGIDPRNPPFGCVTGLRMPGMARNARIVFSSLHRIIICLNEDCSRFLINLNKDDSIFLISDLLAIFEMVALKTILNDN